MILPPSGDYVDRTEQEHAKTEWSVILTYGDPRICQLSLITRTYLVLRYTYDLWKTSSRI